jgi:hypothetical protein
MIEKFPSCASMTSRPWVECVRSTGSPGWSRAILLAAGGVRPLFTVRRQLNRGCSGMVRGECGGKWILGDNCPPHTVAKYSHDASLPHGENRWRSVKQCAGPPPKSRDESMTTSIAEYSPTEAALAGLRERYEGSTYDVTTRTGMATAKEERAELRGWRTALEEERVRIKAPALERCREIDAEAKRITRELVALESPIDAVIKIEEGRKEATRKAREEAEAKAEAERVAAAEAAVASIKVPLLGLVGKPAAAIAACIKGTEAIDATTYAFPTLALAARDEMLAQLEELYASAVKQEANAKRVEEERAALAVERAKIEEQKATIQPAQEDRDDTDDRIESELFERRKRLAEATSRMEFIVFNFGDLPELAAVVTAIKHYLEESNEHH